MRSLKEQQQHSIESVVWDDVVDVYRMRVKLCTSLFVTFFIDLDGLKLGNGNSGGISGGGGDVDGDSTCKHIWRHRHSYHYL